MSGTLTTIWITFQKEGIHCYPDAKNLPGVEFLASPHRHMFHFRVEITVTHDDREIEFILLKREIESWYNDGTLQLNHQSCEMLAKGIFDKLTSLTKYDGRWVSITVSEDNENGSTLTGVISPMNV